MTTPALPPEHSSPAAALLTMVVSAAREIGVSSLDMSGCYDPPKFTAHADARPAGFGEPAESRLVTTKHSAGPPTVSLVEKHKIGTYRVTLFLPAPAAAPEPA